MLKQAALKAIAWYQRTWSPDHSPRKALYPYGYCRYYPTCSQYAYESIDRYDVLIGGLMALWRVLRCNPWSKGGHDPVK